ncbi:MAG TPA: hypothetical protein VHE61_24000 [Opitutaceae bacterium]|nr:hypothetical protein [Opitutaceae bacterium]
MCLHLRLLFAAALVHVPPTRAALELSAFMETGGQSRFVLTDRTDNFASDWLALGQSFRGYRLVSYDAPRETLLLRKDDRTVTLALKGSRVRPVPPPPELTAAGLAPEDLVIRDGGPVRIALVLGSTPQRFINVRFDNGTDRCGIAFGSNGPDAITRALVPEAVRLLVTDTDIAAINARLTVVRAKWLGVQN